MKGGAAGGPAGPASGAFDPVQGPQRGLQGPPHTLADLLQLGLSRRPPGRRLKMWGRLFRNWDVGFGVFPSRGKSMYIVYIWPTGVAGGRAVPPDVREEPGGALYVHSP